MQMHPIRCLQHFAAKPLVRTPRAACANGRFSFSLRSSCLATRKFTGLQCRGKKTNKVVDAEAPPDAPPKVQENGAPASSGVAAALVEAETAVKDGSLDISTLESLIPEAVSEVEGLLARAEAAEAAQAQSEQDAKASHERYLRLTADFDNFRKRSGVEKEQLGDRIRGDVIKALVPLVDSFEAAQNSVKAETENEQKINAAYQGLYKQMVETFKSLGVEVVPGVGEPFDPEFHDAIMREPSNEVPDGTILQEFRRGFRLGSNLLRPGMVKVSFTEDTADASGEITVEGDSASD